MQRNRTHRALALVLSAWLFAGCGSDDAATDPNSPQALASQLDPLLDRSVADGVVGVGLYVQWGDHAPYLQTRGLANTDGAVPLAKDSLFRIASMSKPYLSALLVKLEVEGRLSLEDPITDHLPGEITALIPNASEIRVIDMLTMWSGIVDYRDMTFTVENIFGDHGRVRDEYTDLMDGLTRNPMPCAPPRVPLDALTDEIAGCLYSNTNYVLAGFIADKVLYDVEPAAGVRPAHHSKAFREMFFAPLGLHDTYYEKHLANGESFSARLAHSYATVPTEAGGMVVEDVSTWDDGYGYANGGLISTLSDVAQFRRAIYDTEDPFPMANLDDKAAFLSRLTEANGLGLTPAGVAGEAYWTFSGDIGGFTSMAMYSPETDTSIVIFSNDLDFEERKYELMPMIAAIVETKNGAQTASE